MPVGADIPGSQHTFNVSGTCCTSGSNELSGDPIIACYYGNGTEIAGFPGVYSTGVKGGGIALTNSSGQRVVGGGVSCDTRNTSLGNLDSSLNYQILKGDTTPVNLGQQWAITPSASEGNLSIPFFARYYLNGQTLSSGSANGTATFTMIYY
ncbi:hypothetical protein J1786_25855 [Rahnella sp. L72c]|uniref:Fimbrial protein n=1 Tax=Rahnella perminowiae TaxID=2816244 RepID=A0ABS6L9L8_9GAMM|nr:hypothetical protein [Rahnella perminowiae]MBU9838215.1 hypothetical protein [Rahnella perminowiae]